MNWYDNATDAQMDLLNSVLHGGQLTGEGDTLYLEKQHAAVSFNMLKSCVEPYPLIKIGYGQLAKDVLEHFGSVEHNPLETVFRQVNHSLHAHVFARTLDPLSEFPFLALMTTYRALCAACDLNSQDIDPEDRIRELGTMFVTGACVRVKGQHEDVVRRISKEKPVTVLRAADMAPMQRGDFEFYTRRMKNSASCDYMIDFAPEVTH